MKYVMFIGAKGGVGTTVAAATYALDQAHAGKKIVLWDYHKTGDLVGVFGTASLAAEPVPNVDGDGELWLVNDAASVDMNAYLEDVDVCVIDGGVDWEEADLPIAAPLDYVLVSTQCYLALKRWLSKHGQMRVDALVVVSEPGRVLTAADVRRTTGCNKMVAVEKDMHVARTVDAGLFAHRYKRQDQFSNFFDSI